MSKEVSQKFEVGNRRIAHRKQGKASEVQENDREGRNERVHVCKCAIGREERGRGLWGVVVSRCSVAQRVLVMATEKSENQVFWDFGEANSGFEPEKTRDETCIPRNRRPRGNLPPKKV